jgi:hypothetical protein
MITVEDNERGTGLISRVDVNAPAWAENLTQLTDSRGFPDEADQDEQDHRPDRSTGNLVQDG